MARERRLSRAQRDYLAAFDRFLLARTKDERTAARESMQHHFTAVCRSAGVTPKRQPRMSDHDLVTDVTGA